MRDGASEWACGSDRVHVHACEVNPLDDARHRLVAQPGDGHGRHAWAERE